MRPTLNHAWSTAKSRRTLLAIAAVCAGLSGQAAAQTQSSSPTEAVIPAPAAAKAAVAASEAAKKVSFVIVPIPQSSPTLGNGLAVASLLIYEPKGAGRPWTTAIGATKTDNGSKAAGIFQKASFAGDRFRVTAGAAYGDFNVKFYGVGAAAGDRGEYVELNQSGTGVLAEGLVRIMPKSYLGLRFRYVDVDTVIEPQSTHGITIPQVELTSRVASLGIAAEYDSRDSEFQPRHGVYAASQWLVADKSLGSDFNYKRFEVAANGYWPVGEKGVLAGRVAGCYVGDGVPFYDLCFFGQNRDLRGYPAGQYRDRVLAAAQVEYRRPMFWRLGMVAFAGVGGVGRKLSDVPHDLLPAAGLGLRLEASKAHKVNASLDFAVGKDSQAVYLYIGEAF